MYGKWDCSLLVQFKHPKPPDALSSRSHEALLQEDTIVSLHWRLRCQICTDLDETLIFLCAEEGQKRMSRFVSWTSSFWRINSLIKSSYTYSRTSTEDDYVTYEAQCRRQHAFLNKNSTYRTGTDLFRPPQIGFAQCRRQHAFLNKNSIEPAPTYFVRTDFANTKEWRAF